MTATLNQIERACVDLARDGHPITFVGIAQRTGTARSTLYRNPALRTVIEEHRRAAPDGTITTITDELATLRATVQTLANTVRHHDTQLRRLTHE
jgi:hypothetical protein